ncbi:MAG: SH3 domain-containing protein [Rickettsiales bacterium]
MMLLRFISVVFFCFICFDAYSAEESGGNIPRFVSLRVDEANVRTGPGTRYPILWVYRKKDFPVEIIEEFGLWKKIRDMDNSIGWVHKSMLKGARRAIVRKKRTAFVRIDHDEEAKPLIKLSPKVVVNILECDKRWCYIQVSGHKGWIQKEDIWGVYSYEIIE